MNRMFRIWMVAIGLCTLPAVAGADTFMLIQGVAGDATDPAHKGWIRISSVDWAVSSPTTIGSATGGAGAGKTTGDELHLTIPTGPWSREFVNTLTRGAHFTQVVIEHINTDGRPSYRVAIQTLFLTKYQIAATSKAQPEDQITGVFGGFRVEYFAVTAEGKVTSSPVGWNLVTNTAN